MNPDPTPSPTGGAAAVRLRRRDPDNPPPADAEALCARLYAARGAAPSADADLGLAGLLPFDALAGIAEAAERVAAALCDSAPILVVGDYDADGATGSALGVLGLRALGAAQVDYLIPSRFADGYGLSPPVVEAASRLAPRPRLILTVDNGIAGVAGVARAGELGIEVVITDHHLPGETLPAAAAIVNPRRPDCAFPSKHLAGVGVVFYLLAAVRARLRAQGWFASARPEPNLAGFLDLVALGTVADVVTLDENNRILVEQGLRRIRAGRCRAGIRALLGVAGRDPARATARDLAFVAGPRLNAAGRLADMGLGVECLLTEDPARALAIAGELDGLNRARRTIEREMQDQAEALLADLHLDGTALPPGLCLFAPGWHQGVTGILAARLRERYHRPVIAFGEAGDGLLRGSARSIDGLHIRDLIAAVDRAQPGLVGRFGGHAMAAGLSLASAALDGFRAAFEAAVADELGERPPVRELVSDGPLPGALLTLATAERLRFAGPWGKGFPEPLFDGPFEVLGRRIVGERHLRLRVRPAGPDGGGAPLEAIGFGLAEQADAIGRSAHLAYRLDVNDYQGVRSPQLIIEFIDASPTVTSTPAEPSAGSS
ncbi:single-stranded-DNA-specific exonuclease RecJ [Thiococcus pfennigii]|uniref:single-stranded-DNA-specific exonuclease RecJ n=2 Tax=Thiococcus pfennigii TaxID=1057 RepID=UPI0019037EF0|nr:single-stranded-DNA-specific exonuclease RecJ [Thiococcus pfennigii]MBK1732513.1 single-stranded-DNA-specific exonuclease RecJ [Thiococcus pfennigii]